MGYEVMLAKVGNSEKPTVFKTVLSTPDRTEIPLDSPIRLINEYILTKNSEEFPATCVIESSTALQLFEWFTEAPDRRKIPRNVTLDNIFPTNYPSSAIDDRPTLK